MRPSAALAAHRAELRQLASHYGLSHPRIFGSVLAGTDDGQSDLDLLVDPAENTSLLTLAAFKREPKPCLACRSPASPPMRFRRSSAARSCRRRSFYEAPGARRRFNFGTLPKLLTALAAMSSRCPALKHSKRIRRCKTPSSATSRSSARPRITSTAWPRSSLRSIRNFRGTTCATCATSSFTPTLPWTYKLSGAPFRRICRS